MEKKKYSKPVVVAERFEPQESVAACEVIDIVTGFYISHDQFIYGGLLHRPLYCDLNDNNHFDSGEEIDLPFFRPDRIPGRTGSIEGSPKPLGHKCYRSYGIWGDRSAYSDEESPVYEIYYEGRYYYYTSYNTTSTGTQKTLS